MPTRFLILAMLVASTAAQVRFTSGPGKIDVVIDKQPFTTLYFGEDANKPYLWPLRSAGGAIVTRRWPMEHDTGETHDHIHHRGLWFAVDEVNGVKFWAAIRPTPQKTQLSARSWLSRPPRRTAPNPEP